METMAMGLVVFAVMMFILCLYLAVGATPAAPGRSAFGAGDPGPDPDMDEQRLVVVSLPKACSALESYTLDIRVTLHRSKDDRTGIKPEIHFHRHNRLDEYL